MTSLNRPDGVEAGRFFEEMQLISDRLNRTLYMAEDAMKLAQAKQRVKEMDNADKKKLKAENEKLKNQIYNQHNKEKDILMAFKHMDGQRETRTIRGIKYYIRQAFNCLSTNDSKYAQSVYYSMPISWIIFI